MPRHDYEPNLPSYQRDFAYVRELWQLAKDLVGSRPETPALGPVPTSEHHATPGSNPLTVPQVQRLLDQPRQEQPVAPPTSAPASPATKPRARGYLHQAVEPERVRVKRQALEGRSAKQGWQRIEEQLKDGG